jgi:hypothetical protein
MLLVLIQWIHKDLIEANLVKDIIIEDGIASIEMPEKYDGSKIKYVRTSFIQKFKNKR